MPVPNTFANATATIPLSQLDANFATTITLGNTAIQLGNTVSTLNNMTLANVTVTSGNVTITTGNITVTNANVTTANVTDLTVSNSAVISVNTSGNALRITQTGAGNALVVEDSANPDATPFVVDANGTVVVGHTVPLASLYDVQSITTDGASYIAQRYSASTGGAFMRMDKSRGASIGTNAIVLSGDTIGTIQWRADDGTAFISAASISAEVDGTPGTNDMPGRLVFSTTADGASTPTERMRLDNAGNLGLGVTPSAWRDTTLAIQLGNYGSVFAYKNSGNVYLNNNSHTNSVGNEIYINTAPAGRYRINDNVHAWYIAPSGTAGNAITFTQAMTLDASGNLGVGITSPVSLGSNIATIDIGASSGGGIRFRTSGAGNSGYLLANASGVDLGTNDSVYLRFVTAATERARINSAGYSKFSDNGTYLGSTNTFHEFRQSANDVTLIVHGSNTSQTDNVMYVRASRNTTNNTFYAFGYYNDAAGAYKMRVADSGTITNTTGTYTTISDIKLKQDIVDASSQWDDIKALRIVKYRLKEYVQNDPDSKPFLGLIAQEVEQVCPSLVEEQEDEVMDEDGKLVKNGEVTKGVKTSILYMKAVKALQEAMTRIEALEAEVQALKGNA